MEMTEDEIVIDYKQAKSKPKQIQILAERNMCSRNEIRDILNRHGCEVATPGRKPKQVFGREVMTGEAEQEEPVKNESEQQAADQDYTVLTQEDALAISGKEEPNNEPSVTVSLDVIDAMRKRKADIQHIIDDCNRKINSVMAESVLLSKWLEEAGEDE